MNTDELNSAAIDTVGNPMYLILGSSVGSSATFGPRSLVHNVLATSVVTSQAENGNLFNNSSFERDVNGDGIPDGWSKVNPSNAATLIDTTDFFHGTKSFKITKSDWLTSSDNYYATTQTVTGLTGGSQITVSMYYKLTNTSGLTLGPRSVGFVLYIRDAYGNIVNVITDWSWADASSWTRHAYTTTLPSNAWQVQVELRMSCSGTWQMDAAQFEVAGSASTYVDAPIRTGTNITRRTVPHDLMVASVVNTDEPTTNLLTPNLASLESGIIGTDWVNVPTVTITNDSGSMKFWMNGVPTTPIRSLTSESNVSLSAAYQSGWSGLYSLKIQPYQAEYVGTAYSSATVVTAGLPYSVSFKVKGMDASTYVAVGAVFYDVSGNPLTESTLTMTSITNGAWSTLSYANVTAPVGATTMRLKLYTKVGTTGNYVLFDAFQVEQKNHITAFTVGTRPSGVGVLKQVNKPLTAIANTITAQLTPRANKLLAVVSTAVLSIRRAVNYTISRTVPVNPTLNKRTARTFNTSVYTSFPGSASYTLGLVRPSTAYTPTGLAVSNNVPRFYLNGVMVEQGTTNLFSNPRITGTLGGQPTGMAYSAPNALTVSSDIAGWDNSGYVAKHVRGNGGDSNVGFMSIANPSTLTSYVASCYVWIPSAFGGSAVTLSMEAANFFGYSNGTADLSKRDQWQRISCTFSTSATQNTSLPVVLRITGNNGEVVYSDAWQLEQTTNSVPTSFTVGTRAQERVFVPVDYLPKDQWTFALWSKPILPVGQYLDIRQLIWCDINDATAPWGFGDDDPPPIFSIHLGTNGNLPYFSLVGSVNVVLNSSTPVSNTAATHWIVSYDGTQIKLYVNGTLVDSDAYTRTSNEVFAPYFYIGSGGANASLGPGLEASNTVISAFRVFDKGVSDSEAAAIYAASATDGFQGQQMLFPMLNHLRDIANTAAVIKTATHTLSVTVSNVVSIFRATQRHLTTAVFTAAATLSRLRAGAEHGFLRFRAVAEDGTTYSFTNLNRKYTVSYDKIVQDQRTSTGTMRRRFIANKRTFNFSWEWLPYLDADVPGGGSGGKSLKELFEKKGTFTLCIPDNVFGEYQYYTVFASQDGFSREVEFIGDKMYWHVQLSFEEV